MLTGLIGVIIPAIPGIPLMAIVAILYNFFTGGLSSSTIVILLTITAISIIVDYFSGILGSRLAGASAKSTLLGIIGMLIFIGFVPPIGAIIGLFTGILIGELVFKKDAKKAIKAAGVSAISAITGILINVILALSFLVIFLVSAISNL